MKTRPILVTIVGYCVLALLAAVLGVPSGPAIVYADGTSPEPPHDPGPPGDSTVDAANTIVPIPADKTSNVDGKHDVSLWRLVQLIALGVI